MPVKPDPPTRALGRAIADAVARRALFVALHARDADRLLDHIQRVEAQRDALADALRAMYECYEGVYDMAVPTKHQSDEAKEAEAKTRAALAALGEES